MKSLLHGCVLLFLFCLSPGFSYSQNLYTENFPPYNYQVEGELLGLSSKIVQQIARELEVEPTITLLPWARAYKYATERKNSGLFSIVRIPQREADFQWVGPLATVDIGIYASELTNEEYSGKNEERLEQAKKAVSIGVQRGGASERILTSLGFKNLDYAQTTRKAVLKLVTNRYALLVLDGNYLAYILEAERIPSTRIRRIADLGAFDLYLGFSNSTPKSTIKKWQLALDKIRSSQPGKVEPATN